MDYKQSIINLIKTGELNAIEWGRFDEWLANNASFLQLLLNGEHQLISYSGVNNEIATLHLKGVIGDFFTNTSSVSEALEKLEENKNIKSLVLEINSPGGGVSEME